MRGKNADGSRPGVFPRALRGGEEKGPRYPAWYAGLISRNLSGCPQGGAGCGRRGSGLINPEGLWKLAGGITPPVFISFWVAAPEGAGEIQPMRVKHADGGQPGVFPRALRGGEKKGR